MGLLRLLLCLVLALCPLPLGAQAIAAQVPVAKLVPGRSADNLIDFIRFREIGPSEPDGPPSTAGMHAVRHSSTQFGETGAEVVGAITLRNTGDVPGTWVLTTGRGLLERFTLYRQKPGGPPVEIFDNRDNAALGRLLADYQAIATTVDLAPGERVTYLFRFTDNISLWLPMRVKDPETFFLERRVNIALVAAIVGGSLMLLLVNALVFAITGRREFMWLAAAEAAFAFNTLYAEGYTTILLLYRWPEFAELFGEFTRSLFGLLMMQFGRSFLATRTMIPRMDAFLRGLVWLGFGVMALAGVRLAFGVPGVMLVHQVGWLYLVVTALVMAGLGVLALRRGRIFLPLFLAWTGMAVYFVYMTVAVSGLVPSFPVAWHWVGPIGLFECVMATLTLVLHLRALQTERIGSERRAREALLEKLALTEESARLADERARALADLRARDRTIEESAHDTRHVLHALNSAVHFGRRTEGGAPSPDFIALLEASARHLEDIIASTVSSSRGDGRFVALGVCDLARTLDGLAEIYAPIAERGDLSLRVTRDGLGRVLVDEALIGRLISNLINNALKFTQEGGVEVHCDSEDDVLRIVVADTGTGMAGSTLEWLNENAGASGEPEAPVRLGTGWRAIRDIAALLRGSYEIESSAGGTRVTILLPNPVEGGVTPLTFAQFAAAAPGLRVLDLADAVHAADQADPRPTAMVADAATAQNRAESAARAQLLLVRPLCRQMLDHPYVRELANTPAARALSTS